MKHSILSLALAAMVASPALAQDEETDGGRVVLGAFVGAETQTFETDDNGSDTASAGFYGALIGYDYELPSGLILGVEGEVANSGAAFSLRNLLAQGDRARLEAGRELYVGGRFGLRTGKNGFVYVKGGYSNATFEAEYSNGSGLLTESGNFSGYRLGAGGEFEVSSQITVRLEYRFTDYGNIGGFGVDAHRNQAVLAVVGRL